MSGTFNTMEDLVEAMQLLMPASPNETSSQDPPLAKRPLDLPLAPAFTSRGEEALAALRADTPDAGADEQILQGLVAEELAITSALLDTQAQLTVRLGLLLDDPRKMAAVTGVLKEVVAVTNALSRRIEGALGVASNLRAQRRFFEKHAAKQNVRKNTRV
jgi:hypothetical protein